MMPGVCGVFSLEDPTPQGSSEAGAVSLPTATTSSSLAILGPEQAPPLTPMEEDGHLSDEEDSLTTKLRQLPAILSAKHRDTTNYLGRSSAVSLLKVAITLCSRLAPHSNAGSIFGNAWRRPEVI